MMTSLKNQGILTGRLVDVISKYVGLLKTHSVRSYRVKLLSKKKTVGEFILHITEKKYKKRKV